MNIHPLPYQKGRRRDEEKIKRYIYIYIYIYRHTHWPRLDPGISEFIFCLFRSINKVGMGLTI
jgi:hypothetical protein